MRGSVNTTSLEISKRLYKLSGWDDTDKFLHLKGNGDTMLFTPIAKHLSDCDAPAYDLGYLLRKLPAGEYSFIRNYSGNSWILDCVSYQTTSNTPEDAAGLLAIKLLEEGVLK